MAKTLAFILAGGKGERLYPLTKDRAKPSVPFGGKYRIIDFVINNLINSEFYKIKILTQFKADSLIRHITQLNLLSPAIGQYLDIVPAQMRTGEDWYKGTADAIYQNLNLIYDEDPDYVLVFGGDHIYKMDVRQFLNFHRKKHADMTICAIPVPVQEAYKFGILTIDNNFRVTGFIEKPKENPPTIPGKPEFCLASMGNYAFKTKFLIDILKEDAQRTDSTHDFGKDIIPRVYKDYKIFAYDFSQNRFPGITEKEIGYWRDVGDIDSYYNANMDLCSIDPVFNLYNTKWPIQTVRSIYPPAKFVFEEYGYKGRVGVAYNSLVGEGCIISGATVRNSILFQNVFVHSYAYVEASIIFNNVEIGRYAKIRRAIIDKNVKIPEGVEIGYNLDKDSKKFFVSPNGIVVIPKNYQF
jgi:glucose-1-phosphate adenylyltransferase